MDYVKKFNNFLFEQSGTISASSLRIRKTPEIKDDNIVGMYKKGETIEVLDKQSGWFKTDKGWISSKYVDTTNNTKKQSSISLDKTGKKALQKYLSFKGHKIGAIDGIWGPKTKQSIIREVKTNNSFMSDFQKYFKKNYTLELASKILDTLTNLASDFEEYFNAGKKGLSKKAKKVKTQFKETSFKQFLMKIFPSNVVHWLYPTNLTDKSITSRQKEELKGAIKRSMERENNTKTGIVEYEDWGPEYVNWFDKNQHIPKTELIKRSISDSKFQIATTVGQGVWKESGDKILYTDEYDWNKKKEGYSRYKSAVNVKTDGLNYIAQIRKLQKEANLDLYKAVREIQHRESPVVTDNAPSPKMTFSFDKKEFFA